MNAYFLEGFLKSIYWYAVGELQTIGTCEAWALELERMAAALRKQKPYHPDLSGLGFHREKGKGWRCG